MVPRSMASSMGKRVSPGTYIAQLDLNIGTCLGSTYPTVFLSLFPAITILTDTNDDVEAIVPSIQALAMALGPIADEGQRVIFEVVLELCQGPVRTLVYNLFGACEIESLDSTNGLHVCISDSILKKCHIYDHVLEQSEGLQPQH